MEKRRRRGHKNDHSYGRYLKRVVEYSDSAGLTLSVGTVKILDSMMEDMFNRIVEQASALVLSQKKKTLTHRDIYFATRLVIPDDLGKHAINEGEKAMQTYKGILTNVMSPLTSDDSLEYATFTSNLQFHSSRLDSAGSSVNSSNNS